MNYYPYTPKFSTLIRDGQLFIIGKIKSIIVLCILWDLAIITQGLVLLWSQILLLVLSICVKIILGRENARNCEKEKENLERTQKKDYEIHANYH